MPGRLSLPNLRGVRPQGLTVPHDRAFAVATIHPSADHDGLGVCHLVPVSVAGIHRDAVLFDRSEGVELDNTNYYGVAA